MEHVPSKKASDLWAKVSEHDKDIAQKQNFNEYKFIQDEFLRNLGTTDLMNENYDTCQIKGYRHMQEEIKSMK